MSKSDQNQTLLLPYFPMGMLKISEVDLGIAQVVDFSIQKMNPKCYCILRPFYTRECIRDDKMADPERNLILTWKILNPLQSMRIRVNIFLVLIKNICAVPLLPLKLFNVMFSNEY